MSKTMSTHTAVGSVADVSPVEARPAPASSTSTLAAAAKRHFQGYVARLREAAEDWQLREKLAGLSERSLLDIGVAEEENGRVRARERFRPRSWADEKGCARGCGA